MKKIITLLLLFFSIINGYSQKHEDLFVEAFKSNDTVKIKEVLANWKNSSPDDTHLYLAFFQVYLSKELKKLMLRVYLKKEILDIDESITYDEIDSNLKKSPREKLNLAIANLNEGIKRNPDNLDIRFAKLEVLRNLRIWSNLTKELLSMVEHSKVNNNTWDWSSKKIKKSSGEFFFIVLEDYQRTLGDFDRTEDVKAISESLRKLYPKNVRNLVMLAFVYKSEGDNKKALKCLHNAHKHAPEDCVVLSNIALIYKETGDKPKALKYYNKILKYGDKKHTVKAKKEIEELNKK